MMNCNLLTCLSHRNAKGTEPDLLMCEKCCYGKKTNKIQDKTYSIIREKFVKNFWKNINKIKR